MSSLVGIHQTSDATNEMDWSIRR